METRDVVYIFGISSEYGSEYSIFVCTTWYRPRFCCCFVVFFVNTSQATVARGVVSAVCSRQPALGSATFLAVLSGSRGIPLGTRRDPVRVSGFIRPRSSECP